VTAAKDAGFVEDGPERARSDQPPGFWASIWWWVFGGLARTADDLRKLWWRRS
jgi:hypothetical protein